MNELLKKGILAVYIDCAEQKCPPEIKNLVSVCKAKLGDIQEREILEYLKTIKAVVSINGKDCFDAQAAIFASMEMNQMMKEYSNVQGKI